MSMKAMLDKRNSGSGKLLKGSDVPAGVKHFTIVVGDIHEPPDGFNAYAIIELKKSVYGKTAWPVNQTNLKMIIKLFGEDEGKLVGKKIKLEVISVRNPQTGEIVPSLAVSPKQ